MLPLLNLHHCTKRFPVSGRKSAKLTAVRDVSLEINRDEIMGLAGESGSGKTTLSRLLLGLEKPDEGEIRYQGASFLSLGRAGQRTVRGEIQAIFQDPLAALNPMMRVKDIVMEPLKIHGMVGSEGKSQVVKEMIASVGLPDNCLMKRPDQLSGGEQQRVCIARALVLRPRLLVADEPVSALDAELRADIMNLLKQSRDKYGVSILLVAHDLSLFRGIADRVAVMYSGEIVEIGHTESLLEHPQHPYTVELLKSVPPYTREQLIRNTGKNKGVTGTLPEGKCRYLSRCSKASGICKTDLSPERKSISGMVRCHY